MLKLVAMVERNWKLLRNICSLRYFSWGELSEIGQICLSLELQCFFTFVHTGAQTNVQIERVKTFQCASQQNSLLTADVGFRRTSSHFYHSKHTRRRVESKRAVWKTTSMRDVFGQPKRHISSQNGVVCVLCVFFCTSTHFQFTVNGIWQKIM